MCDLQPTSILRHATLYAKLYTVMTGTVNLETHEARKCKSSVTWKENYRLYYWHGFAVSATLNHSVGLTNDDLKALIASAVSYEDRVF